MIIKAPQGQPVGTGFVLGIRCPSCRQNGTFDETLDRDLQVHRKTSPNTVEAVTLGIRRCPNKECQAHVFFAAAGSKLLGTHPSEVIDFDSTNLPAQVVGALQEAVVCHSIQCYVASAIMVRKTLEELCSDREAKGATLKDRIAALASKIVVPQELLDGADELRLLGNDAAHLESREFNAIGEEELRVAIEFAKELLKATYQYSSLLDRLRSLKRP